MPIANWALSPLSLAGLTALSACYALTTSCAPVRADETIIAQQSTVTGQGYPAVRMLKLYYKKANTRVEVDGDPAVVYEAKDGVIYTIDAGKKTFYTTLFSQVTSVDDLVPQGMANRLKRDTKITILDGDESQTIAGVTAHKYLLSGTITFTRPQTGGAHSGGRRHGGFHGGGFPGGFPFGNSYGGRYGGGDNDSSSDSIPTNLPQVNIDGEVWFSDSLRLDSKASPLPAAQLSAASGSAFWQALIDVMAKRHEIPLLARLTVSRTQPAHGTPDQYGGVLENSNTTPQTQAAPVTTTTVTTFTVQSFSLQPLDDKLFTAPLDYSLIAAPVSPYVPGSAPAKTSYPASDDTR